ncbi:unnamed protein product [Sphagnum tenellum]
MLENFAGPTYPRNPTLGQLWYNTNRQGICTYVGIGGPDADNNGWTGTFLLADQLTDLVGNLPLSFTGDVSANGTIAEFDSSNPPPLILATVNTDIGTFNNVTVDAKGRVLSAYNTAYVTNVVASGDVSGSLTGNSLPLTLATVNNNIGTFNNISVNAKGLVLSAYNIPYLTDVIASGDVSGTSTGNSLPLTLAFVNSDIGTFNTLTVNEKGLVTSAYNTPFFTDVIASGDASGTSTGNALPLTLATVNSNVGTFNTLSVNAKGLVLSAFNTPYLTDVIASGDASGTSTGNALTLTLNTVNSNVGTFNTITVNAKGLVTSAYNTSFATGNEAISITGDATGSGTTSIPLTLATVNSNVGTFGMLTVNNKGLVTAARALNQNDITSLGIATSASVDQVQANLTAEINRAESAEATLGGLNSNNYWGGQNNFGALMTIQQSGGNSTSPVRLDELFSPMGASGSSSGDGYLATATASLSVPCSGKEPVLIHGCNASGIAYNAGVAGIMRKRYPAAFEAYRDAHLISPLQVGDVIWLESEGIAIGNAITQHDYGNNPNRVYCDYDGVRKAMRNINEHAWGLEVRMPLIGAGLANGKWSIISKIIEEESIDFQPVVYLLDGRLPL